MLKITKDEASSPRSDRESIDRSSSVLSDIETLLKILQSFLVIALLLIVFFTAFKIFSNFKSIKTIFLGSERITDISETDALITSIAQIDLLRVGMDERAKGKYKRHHFEDSIHWYLEFDMIKDAETFCLNTYTVIFGYNSASASKSYFKENNDLARPEIIAINPTRTESGPKALDQCEKFNHINYRDELSKDILYILEDQDHVLDDHIRQGQRALATHIDQYDRLCFGPDSTPGCATSALSKNLIRKSEVLENKIENSKSRINSAQQSIKELYISSLIEQGKKFDKSFPKDIQTLASQSPPPIQLSASNISSQLAQDIISYSGSGRKTMNSEIRLSELEEELTNQYYNDEGMRTDTTSAIVDSKTSELFKQVRNLSQLNNDYKKDNSELAEINLALSKTSFGANTMTVTVSLIAAVTQNVEYFWGLFDLDKFYIKRDIAKIMYGSTYSALPLLDRTGQFFAPFSSREIIELPQPSVLAIDRWTQNTAKKGELEVDGRTKATYGSRLNSQISALLENAIMRIDNFAVQTSENIIVKRIQANHPNKNIHVRFIQTNNREPLAMNLFEKTATYSTH